MFTRISRLKCFVLLLSALACVPFSGLSQGASQVATKAEAVQRALREGKLIITDFGRDGCTDCDQISSQMEYVLPAKPIRQMLMQCYVVWTNDVNFSQEWRSYIGGGYSLPYLILIDPFTPDKGIGTPLTGITPATTLFTVLAKQSERLPVAVTNLPTAPITDSAQAAFTFKGSARTNATLGASKGIPISAVMCRVANQGGPFLPATGTTKWTWSMQEKGVQLQAGTNYFESYVVYSDGVTVTNSWTNRVMLVYTGAVVGDNRPQITSQPLSLTNQVGTTAQFAVVATSATPMTYQWRHGGVNLSGQTLSSLALNNAQFTDAGDYDVVVSNSAGDRPSSAAHLTVYEKAKVTAQPANQEVVLNGQAVFTVTAGGNPTPNYQWRRGGVALAGETRNTLTISNVQIDQIGAYDVVVANAYSSDTSHVATLTLLTTLDNLAVAPTQQVVAPGGVAAFSAVVSGANLLFRWETNGVPLPDAPPFVGVTSNVLTIANVQLPEAVTYTVAVSSATQTNRASGTLLLDSTAPIVAVTNYADLQSVAESRVTLRGTVQDPLPASGIASVLVSISGQAAPVTAVVSGATWSCVIDLGSGTNTITVTALDRAGQTSHTNIRLLRSVDSEGPLLTLGSPTWVRSSAYTVAGTASDDASGGHGVAWVRVNNYNVPGANATNGGLVNWSRVLGLTAGTNHFVITASDTLGNWRTNTYDVMMDAVPPMQLTITSPKQNQQASNSFFIATGTVKDNLAVAGVYYQLNSGAWRPASGLANWEAVLDLVPGTNTFRVYASDFAGNRSATNSVKVTFVRTGVLGLIVTGAGTVSPNYSNAVLELGRNYATTAIPGSGQILSNWVGTVLGNTVLSSTSNKLTFTMQSNLVLHATFMPNPFLGLKGTYNGLFQPMGGDPTTTNAGSASLTLANNGSFSGRLGMGTAILPFTGVFDSSLTARVNVRLPASKTVLVLNLALNPVDTNGDTNVLSGMLVNPNHWEAELLAFRAATKATSYAGAYTWLLAGCGDWGQCFGLNTNLPNGDSPAAVTVNSTGLLQMRGSLADGTVLTQNTTISEAGYWPVYVSLYGGKGLLLGWMNVGAETPTSLCYWLMPPGIKNSYYSATGVAQHRNAWLAQYEVPAPRQNPINWTNATVVLTGGNIPFEKPLTNQVVLTNGAFVVQSGSISNLTLSVTANNGQFKGSFINPGSGKLTSFTGALEPKAEPNALFYLQSGGWWLGPNGEGGNVRIVPR